MNNIISEVSEIQVSYKPNKIVNSKITTSFDAVQIIRKFWNQETIQMQEETKILFTDSSNTVIGVYSLSKGGLTGTLVDIRLILSVALKCLATGIIFVHNHPSGNLNPSNADLSIMNKLKTACKLLDIALLDSIIITKESYMSFTDEGLL